MSFSDEVDAALQGLRVVLGSGDPPAPSAPRELSAAPSWPNWTGIVSNAAHDASNDLDQSRTKIHFDQTAAVSLIKHAGTVTTSARSRMDGVQAGWQQDKAQFAPIANTPLGQLSLLHAGQKRLSDARDVIRDAMNEFSSAAQKLTFVISDLPLTPGGGGGTPPPRPISPFHQDGIEEGGTPGSDPAHNQQGLRGDEGVMISGNRIVFGDSMVMGADGKLHYMHAPMYHYHLDPNGKPILDGPPVEYPEQGVDGTTNNRIIPTGGTGPQGMPNGTQLLFGKDWKLGGSQDFPNETQVFDTSGSGQFPKVTTIPGIRDITAVPYGQNQLLITGVKADGQTGTRGIWVTPAQSGPGNYGFLDPKSWTQVGQLPAQGGLGAEPTANLFHVDTPAGTQYGLVSPNMNGSGLNMRIAPTPELLAQTPETQIVAPNDRPGTYLYSPNVTQIVPQPGGGYRVNMTFSERMAPPGVDPGDLANQTYQNVFGHVDVVPPPAR